MSLDFSTIIASVIAFINGYIVIKSKRNDTYAKDRYEKAILPAFILIEPFLYNDIDDQIYIVIEKLYRLVMENRIYISGKLLDIADYCYKKQLSNELQQENFDLLCLTISKEYDKSCKQLGIPLRTFMYKRRNKQYSSSSLQMQNYLNNLFAKIILYISVLCTVFITFYLCKMFLEYIFYSFQ